MPRDHLPSLPPGLFGVAAALILAACGSEPTSISPETASRDSRGSLRVTPPSLQLASPGLSKTLTATVQYAGLLMASSSNPRCARVSPASTTSREKPPGSSVYVAQFTVTPVGPAWCTVSVTDKKGNVAVAGVHVVLARIAFVSNPDGLYHQVYVMDPDGQHLTLLTTDHTDKGQPAWSPDRTRIAFMSQGSTPTDVGEIWVMDADGRTRPASPSTVRPTATLPGHLTG